MVASCPSLVVSLVAAHLVSLSSVETAAEQLFNFTLCGRQNLLALLTEGADDLSGTSERKAQATLGFNMVIISLVITPYNAVVSLIVSFLLSMLVF